MSVNCVQFRFIDFNYFFQDNVSISASSENVNFPAVNVGDHFRSKVWRSSGHFVIDATNNKIDFREVIAGPELTATITSGTFSPTALAAEIKAQMEAVSVETYTISFSTTDGRWTIATGGSHLDLLFGTGTNKLIRIGLAIGYSEADRTGSTSYTGVTAIHTEEFLLIDLKTSENIDSFIGVFDPRLGVNFTENAVLTLEASATANFTGAPVSITLDIDNRELSLSHFFTISQAFRFWRLKIVDPGNVAGFVELGSLVLGLGKQLTRKVSKGFSPKRRDRSRVRSNQFGNVYSDELPTFKSMEFEYRNFDGTDLDSLEDIYRNVGVRIPFVIALDPTEVLFDKDKFLIYGRFSRQLNFKHVVRDNFNASFRVEEVF